jgi:hypothetical protein
VFHVGAARNEYGALGNHFLKDALAHFVHGNDIFQIDGAAPAFSRAFRPFPLLFQVQRPLAAKAALQDPALNEGSVRDHGPHHWCSRPETPKGKGLAKGWRRGKRQVIEKNEFLARRWKGQ